VDFRGKRSPLSCLFGLALSVLCPPFVEQLGLGDEQRYLLDKAARSAGVDKALDEVVPYWHPNTSTAHRRHQSIPNAALRAQEGMVQRSRSDIDAPEWWLRPPRWDRRPR